MTALIKRDDYIKELESTRTALLEMADYEKSKYPEFVNQEMFVLHTNAAAFIGRAIEQLKHEPETLTSEDINKILVRVK